MKELSFFVSFESLKLSLYLINDDSFANVLKMITNECKKLENIDLFIDFECYNHEFFYSNFQ